METLATNAVKANLVHFLAVDCVRRGNNQEAMAYLLKALINMHTLSDLRLRTRFFAIDSWTQDLADILWSVHEVLIVLKLTNLHAVKIISNYKLCTATITTMITFSTFLESSSIKPSCRYLEYGATTAISI